MFIRNAWYVAAWSDQLAEGPAARRILDEPVVLFRDKSGKAAAIADRCCHRGTPLSLGEVVEDGLQCGYHGMVFDGTGKCVRIPGQDRIPEKAAVPSYPVVERQQVVWIWMGEATQADPARIIDLPHHDDRAHWGHRHATIPIKADYMLMVDNLMDLTHLGYVHRRTVGGNPDQHVEAEMQTSRTETGVRFVRWLRNSTPPPTYVDAYGFEGRVDRWQDFEWIAPSSVRQWTGAKNAGEGDEGDREGGFQFRIFHSLTPETESSCLYFWASAIGFKPHDGKANDDFAAALALTFDEDKAIVEEQQRRLDEFGEDWLVNIVSDATRVQMRRIFADLLAGERPLAAE